MVGVRSLVSRLKREVGIADRTANRSSLYGSLMRVTNREFIGAQRFLYTVVSARINSSLNPELDADRELSESALSISELSNSEGYFSYGVSSALPGTFTAQPIPTGAYVWCIPSNMTGGEFLWLIVNTQAIDGQCDTPLVGTFDFGSFTNEVDLLLEGGDFDAPMDTEDFGTFGVVDGGTFALVDFDYDFLNFATGGSAANYLFGSFN